MTVLTKSIASAVLEELITYGVEDFCLAPGIRNAPFVSLLKQEKSLSTYYFNDERCAAFFALGRSRQTERPVGIIVTSGTAIAHLLPAAIESFYTSVPLVLITTDRPSRFRGTNAPQSCEQVGIYGPYAPCQIDLEEGDAVDLSEWDRKRPLHINVCLEEPRPQTQVALLQSGAIREQARIEDGAAIDKCRIALDLFIKNSRFPFVTVGSLKEEAREAVAQFLLKLGAPVYLEAISGLREDPRLQPLAIHMIEKFWQSSKASSYSIDTVLRIGGVPTPRFWRDLEEYEGKIEVLSINEEPFSGLSWGKIAAAPLKSFFSAYQPPLSFKKEAFSRWKMIDFSLDKQLEKLYEEEPLAEASLIHSLSKLIPAEAHLFLGNSLPIRHWNMAACRHKRHPDIGASRGVNGIDGQLSTFLGWSIPGGENWALLGDMTALHDLGGWWILHQMHETDVKVVVVNNGGGKIFASRQFHDKEMQNPHTLHFDAVAQLWGISYERWHAIPQHPKVHPEKGACLIELIPDESATHRFTARMQALKVEEL